MRFLFENTKTATASVPCLTCGTKGTKSSLLSWSVVSRAVSSQNETFSSASDTFFLRSTIRPSLRPYSRKSGQHTRRQVTVKTTRTVRSLSGQLQQWLDWHVRGSMTGMWNPKQCLPNTSAGPVLKISCARKKLTLSTFFGRFRTAPALKVPVSGFAPASAGI